MMNQFKLITEQKKSGNSYYIAYYTINGKQKKFSSGVQYTGKRKDEHLAFSVISSKIAEAERKSNNPIIGDNNQLFVDFMSDYIEGRIYKTESTKLSYKKLFKARIQPYFTQHKIRLKDLKKADIESFYSFLYGTNKSGDKSKPLSHKYVKNIHGLLTSALDVAQERNLCENVAKKVKIIQPDEFDGVVIYKEEDFIAMINASKNVDNATILINLLCRTGMRLGELINLQWKNFDSETGSLRITKSKTAAGKRVLSIGHELCNLLIEEKERQARYKSLFAETYNNNDYIVKQIDGKPLSDKQVRNRVHKTMELAKLEKGRVHDIRHSVVVHLLDRNQNIYSISQYMGHKNLSSTKRYMHFSPRQSDKIAETLNF